MNQIIIVLFAICGVVVIAANKSGDQAEWPISRDGLRREVVGGGGCFSYKMYRLEDLNCTGEVVYEGGYTVGASIEDGCVDFGDGTSGSWYCDNAGLHYVFFEFSSDCSGYGAELSLRPNGCDEEFLGVYYNYRNSCSVEGPCDGGGVKSVE
mmetsp:Transcript_51500/g.61944  ORF Transcript_51500/g.61944 Transcript_51500/m.61944 type:complete len:152 (+) Transcript_51500:194-649(+)